MCGGWEDAYFRGQIGEINEAVVGILMSVVVTVVREVEVWWMGGCLFQGTGRCGVWMVDDLCLFS